MDQGYSDFPNMVFAHTYTFGYDYHNPLMFFCIYTLMIILYLLYFRFIYSILYTHLFQKYKLLLHLPVQNQSEIVSKFTQTFASLKYCTLHCITLFKLALALLRLVFVQFISNLFAHTQYTFTLTHPHSSYTPRTLRGFNLTLMHLDILFYGILFGLIQSLQASHTYQQDIRFEDNQMPPRVLSVCIMHALSEVVHVVILNFSLLGWCYEMSKNKQIKIHVQLSYLSNYLSEGIMLYICNFLGFMVQVLRL